MLEKYFKDKKEFEKEVLTTDPQEFEVGFEKFLNKLTKEVDTTNGSNW